jgi:hypothetical protein
MKFFIVDRQVCTIAWRFPVEADTESEALEKFVNGEHGEAVGPEIGDSIDFLQYDLDVEVVEEEQALTSATWHQTAKL